MLSTKQVNIDDAYIWWLCMWYKIGSKYTGMEKLNLHFSSSMTAAHGSMGRFNHKDTQMETHECVLSNEATDVLVLTHQSISIHSAD